MKVVFLEPGEKACVRDIPHTLEEMQKAVGGYIQAVYPWEDAEAALVCDEEGLLKKSPFNRKVAPEVFIFGSCFICGLGEEDFTDLPEPLIERFLKQYQFPELLFKLHGKLYSMPVES